MRVTIYHNPRCSKSRQTLQLLQERGIDLEVVEYLETPPDRDRLNQLLGLLDMEPRELMRTAEAVYRDKGLDDQSLDRDTLLSAMIDDPILIERPIVVVDDRKARVGRPPESVLEIL